MLTMLFFFKFTPLWFHCWLSLEGFIISYLHEIGELPSTYSLAIKSWAPEEDFLLVAEYCYSMEWVGSARISDFSDLTAKASFLLRLERFFISSEDLFTISLIDNTFVGNWAMTASFENSSFLFALVHSESPSRHSFGSLSHSSENFLSSHFQFCPQ